MVHTGSYDPYDMLTAHVLDLADLVARHTNVLSRKHVHMERMMPRSLHGEASHRFLQDRMRVES